jgi:hypothetical protein
MRDKDNSTDQVNAKAATPSSPERVIFVSNDEHHTIELEAAYNTSANGMPVRVEGSRIQFVDRVLNIPSDATLLLKASNKKINIVEFLRNYHRNNLDYREAIDLELVNGSKTPYIDMTKLRLKLSVLVYGLLKVIQKKS